MSVILLGHRPYLAAKAKGESSMVRLRTSPRKGRIRRNPLRRRPVEARMAR